jgi:PAS domain S-box-containing protein
MADVAAWSSDAECALLVIDADGRITFADATAARVFGHPDGTLPGRSVDTLIPERLRVAYLAALRRYFAAASETFPASALRLQALHRSGDEFPVEVVFADEVDGCREVRVRPLREMSERLRGEELLLAAKRYAQETADRMSAVAGAASGMLGARSLDDLKDIVLAACRTVIPFDAFTFGIYDPHAHTLAFLATRDSGIDAPPLTVAVANTPSERVVRDRRSLVTLSSAQSDAEGSSLVGTMRRSESTIRTPILSADGVHGVISVQSYSPALYGPEDVAVLEAVAAVAATALENIGFQQDREESQRAFLVQQAYLEQLFESAPEGIVLLDNLDRVIRVNPEFTRMFGYSAEEAVGRPINQLLATDTLRTSSIELTERVARGETVSVDTMRRRKDGTILHVSILGTPIRVRGSQIAVYGIYRDITTRKDAEERLAQRERYFRSLIENTSDIVAVVEADGSLRYVSPALERVLGRAPDAVCGGTLYSLMYEDDAPAVAEAFAGALADPALTLDIEARFQHADGSWRLLVLTGRNLQDDPAVRGMIVNLRDVTDARAQDAHVRRVERLASLGTLIGGVAHELNNPLTAIKGFTELMLLNDQPAEDREALETIAREASRAAGIVSNLRLLTRRTQEGSLMGPVDVNDAVRHVLKLRRYSIDTSNIVVHAELDPALTFVWADRGQIEQILLNLVVNAEQALALGDLPRTLFVRTSADGDSAIIEVEDNGPGIRRAELERIFDPFWTTKSPGVGVGLGLSLVHTIVADHGGRIRVESEPGKGALFVIELPAAPAPAPDLATEPPPARAPAHPARPLRILVVDDEPAIRVSIDRFLVRRGHRVETAAEGEEALRIIERAATDPFDVIVSDLRMPGLSGEQLYRILCQRDPSWQQRIVFITGDAANPHAAAFAAAHAPVILKPFDLTELGHLIEDLAQRSAERTPT